MRGRVDRGAFVGAPRRHRMRATDRSRDWPARAERFSETQNVRQNALFERDRESARSSGARENLVGDQEPFRVIADRAQASEKAWSGLHDSAAPEDRLDE